MVKKLIHAVLPLHGRVLWACQAAAAACPSAAADSVPSRDASTSDSSGTGSIRRSAASPSAQRSPQSAERPEAAALPAWTATFSEADQAAAAESPLELTSESRTAILGEFLSAFVRFVEVKEMSPAGHAIKFETFLEPVQLCRFSMQSMGQQGEPPIHERMIQVCQQALDWPHALLGG